MKKGYMLGLGAIVLGSAAMLYSIFTNKKDHVDVIFPRHQIKKEIDPKDLPNSNLEETIEENMDEDINDKNENSNSIDKKINPKTLTEEEIKKYENIENTMVGKDKKGYFVIEGFDKVYINQDSYNGLQTARQERKEQNKIEADIRTRLLKSENLNKYQNKINEQISKLFNPESNPEKLYEKFQKSYDLVVEGIKRGNKDDAGYLVSQIEIFLDQNLDKLKKYRNEINETIMLNNACFQYKIDETKEIREYLNK